MKTMKRILREINSDQRGLSWLVIVIILGCAGLTAYGVYNGVSDLVTGGGLRSSALARAIEDAQGTDLERVKRDWDTGTLKQAHGVGKTVLSGDTAAAPYSGLTEGATISQKIVEEIEESIQSGLEGWRCDIKLQGIKLVAKGGSSHGDYSWEYSIAAFAETKLTDEKYSAICDNHELGSAGKLDIEFDSDGNIQNLYFDRTVIHEDGQSARRTISASRIPRVQNPRSIYPDEIKPKSIQWELCGPALEPLLVIHKLQIWYPPNSDYDEKEGTIHEASYFWCDEGSCLYITLYPK
jgi:hypothetical protein